MNREKFNILVENVIDEIRNRLLHKGKEYANNDNVFANFDKAAIKKNTTPLLALEGMLAKHQVSIDDIIYGVVPYSKALVEEKFLDEVCYRILEMGLLERENTPKENSAVYTYPVYTPKGPIYPEVGKSPAIKETTVTDKVEEETKTLYFKTINGVKKLISGNHTPVEGDLYIDCNENVYDTYLDKDGYGWFMSLQSIGREMPANGVLVCKLDDFNCRDKAMAYFEEKARNSADTKLK